EEDSPPPGSVRSDDVCADGAVNRVQEPPLVEIAVDNDAGPQGEPHDIVRGAPSAGAVLPIVETARLSATTLLRMPFIKLAGLLVLTALSTVSFGLQQILSRSGFDVAGVADTTGRCEVMTILLFYFISPGIACIRPRA
ncbi:hypothetical protein FOL47_003797, partial [Perkinsus chesapeaki]